MKVLNKGVKTRILKFSESCKMPKILEARGYGLSLFLFHISLSISNSITITITVSASMPRL